MMFLLRPPGAVAADTVEGASRRAVLCVAVVLTGPLPGVGAEPVPPPRGDVFTELVASGIDFVRSSGASGEFFLPEITCGAVALLDYDGDGDLDVFLVQGQRLEEQKDAAAGPSPVGTLPAGTLYRNELASGVDGAVELRFLEVTGPSGLEARGYGCGAAAADYDNDGWVDLYVTNLGPNQLFHNQGDGTFREVPLQGGLADARWSVPVTWLDFDLDGWLDLYVGNYLEFDPTRQKVCRTATGARDYCNPAAYAGVSDRLFRNLGDGTFEDVSDEAGLSGQPSKSLGVVAADFNGDGRPDLYVTNDGVPNQLWLQQVGGRFVDEAMLSGCAVNRQGRAEASMGVDAGDFDGDGDLDLFMTHLTGETNTLFLNDGTGLFEDRTVDTGLGPPSWRYTSWGVAWMDYDNDGHLDLVIVNGAVRTLQELADAGDPFPFHQPNQLFHSDGGARFADVSEQAGTAFGLSEVSRGLAVGDLDADGDTDLLLVNIEGPTRVLSNGVGQYRRWLGARLLGGRGGRDMLGGRVELVRDQGERVWRHVRIDGSFGASNDPRTQVGLGHEAGPVTLRAHWPGGEIVEYRSLGTDRYFILRQTTAGALP